MKGMTRRQHFGRLRSAGYGHPITHKSPIVELPGITGTLNEDGNLLHAQPDRPGTRFTIVLSAQKAAALGNQAHHGV